MLGGCSRSAHCERCACPAQVTLYQLLMEERYGEAVERGLLWYLDQAGPDVVRRSPYEACEQDIDDYETSGFVDRHAART